MDFSKKRNGNNHNYTLKKLIFPPLLNGDINKVKIDEESIKYVTFCNSAQEITNIIMNSLNDFPCPNETLIDKWNSLSLLAKMSELVITDMTAGVGGNILNFAHYFKYVNGIEIDPIRCQYLQHNVELYEFINVNYYSDNAIKLLIEEDDLVQDIIFFDPPWGGKDYKNFSDLRLQFGLGEEIDSIIETKSKSPIPSVNSNQSKLTDNSNQIKLADNSNQIKLTDNSNQIKLTDNSTQVNLYSIECVCKLLFEKSRNKMIVLKLPNNYDFKYFISELAPNNVILFSLDRMTIVIVKKYLN
jgi:16S rRNA G966 N2-methylase RsmD